jgi:hypothetical protein
MVVRNGWLVWRSRWPEPGLTAVLRWWAVTLLLTGLRAIDLRGGEPLRGFREALGRLSGAVSVIGETPGRMPV